MSYKCFSKQKYVWRKQRGCVFISKPCIPCKATGVLFANESHVHIVSVSELRAEAPETSTVTF
jgi:hypothetical protein